MESIPHNLHMVLLWYTFQYCIMSDLTVGNCLTLRDDTSILNCRGAQFHWIICGYVCGREGASKGNTFFRSLPTHLKILYKNRIYYTIIIILTHICFYDSTILWGLLWTLILKTEHSCGIYASVYWWSELQQVHFDVRFTRYCLAKVLWTVPDEEMCTIVPYWRLICHSGNPSSLRKDDLADALHLQLSR